jgi:glycyl-tRNA synthetase (class II)
MLTELAMIFRLGARQTMRWRSTNALQCPLTQVHSAKTNVSMEASLYLTEPKVVEYHKLNADKKKIGMTFKAEQKKVVEALEGLSEDAIEALDAKLDAEGSAAVGGYTVTREMVAWKKETKTVSEEKVVRPSVHVKCASAP